MKRVLVTLVPGFETIEAATPIDLMRRAGIQVDVVSVFNTDQVESDQKVTFLVDKKFQDINPDDYDLIYLPGGAGTDNYLDSPELLETLKKFAKDDKWLVAICAAPTVLAKQGLLEHKLAVCYPGMDKALEEGKAALQDTVVVRDGKVLTGRSLAGSVEIGLTMIAILMGEEKRFAIKKEIVY